MPMMQIDLNTLIANFQAAQKKCSALGIELRPHVKTLHAPEICERLRPFGLDKICVSNLDMLGAFLTAGWTDICLALPCSPAWIPILNDYLQQFSFNLILYVDHIDQVMALNQIKQPIQVMIEIDAGQARSGVHWKHEETMKSFIHALADSIHTFKGISAHFGQHYACLTKQDIIDDMAYSMMRVLQLKEHLESDLDTSLPLVVGDTPSFLALDYFDQVSEIRAGNFFLNDLTIFQKGLCRIDQIGCSIRADVIGVFDSDMRIILHVGAVHLSKEKHDNDDVAYGWLLKQGANGKNELIPKAKIVELYQEHAVVTLPEAFIGQIKLGDSLCVLPVHSCLAMDAMVHKQKFKFVE